MQENFLFDKSIRENIRMGRATDEQIEAAARAAEIDDTIRGWRNSERSAPVAVDR